MHIEGDDFSVAHNPALHTITCTGSLELRGEQGYQEIDDLLNSVVEQTAPPDTITLDIRNLECLNSSCLATLARFIIALRNKGGIPLLIKDSKQHTWQMRSMPGPGRLIRHNIEFRYE